MIDNILENKDDPGLDILHKAMESSDPKYNDVSIAIDYPSPTSEGPVFKTYSLKPIEDFSLDTEGKAVITEQGETHIYEQFYGEKSSRDILKNAYNAEGFVSIVVEGATDSINEILANDTDYKEVIEDWQADRLKDSYKRFVPPLVFRVPLQY